jgi:hypothetical protein
MRIEGTESRMKCLVTAPIHLSAVDNLTPVRDTDLLLQAHPELRVLEYKQYVL